MWNSTLHSFSLLLSVLLLSVHCAGTLDAQEDPRYVLPSEEPDRPQRVSESSRNSTQDSEGAQDSSQRAIVDTRSKSYVLEAIIFAALCGAALYVVCRSSPRGT